MDIVYEGLMGQTVLRDFTAAAVRLGGGGAGTVYRHPALPNLALKLYNDPATAAEHAEKVRAMVARPPRNVKTPDGTVQMAWPEGILTEGGGFRGFAMPVVDFGHAWTLQQVTRPTQRARRGIPDSLRLRLYAALNLSIVLDGLHEIGHYVIDLKPQNALVYDTSDSKRSAYVVLVDCDGFQIRGPDGRRHDATLATPEFLHPKAATLGADGSVSFDGTSINDSAGLQDQFALAIIIFQLLNESLHPMSGRETGIATLPAELGARLMHGGRYYPYGVKDNPYIKPDPDSIHTWFSPKLRGLFDRAFSGDTTPPRPGEWVAALRELTDPRTFECRNDENHWRLGDTCGLCARLGHTVKPQPPTAKPGPVGQVPMPPKLPQPPKKPVPIRMWRQRLKRTMLRGTVATGVALGAWQFMPPDMRAEVEDGAIAVVEQASDAMPVIEQTLRPALQGMIEQVYALSRNAETTEVAPVPSPSPAESSPSRPPAAPSASTGLRPAGQPPAQTVASHRTAPQDLPIVALAVKDLSVFSGPRFADKEELGRLEKGAKVSARVHDSGWYQISLSGVSGYVPRSSFRVVGYRDMDDCRMGWDARTAKPSLSCQTKTGTRETVELD